MTRSGWNVCCALALSLGWQASAAAWDGGIVVVFDASGAATQPKLSLQVLELTRLVSDPAAIPQDGTVALGLIVYGKTAAPDLPLTTVTPATLAATILPALDAIAGQFQQGPGAGDRFEAIDAARSMLAAHPWGPQSQLIVHVGQAWTHPQPNFAAEVTDSASTEQPIIAMGFSENTSANLAEICIPETMAMAVLAPGAAAQTHRLASSLLQAGSGDQAEIDVCGPGPGPGPGCTCSDDGLYCTLDFCSGGVCTHPARSCDDSNACTTNQCNETLNRCDNLPNGQSCDDGNACTTADVCQSTHPYLCVGSPVVVDDGDPCTLDSCDPASGPVHQDCCAHDPQDPDCNQNGLLDSCDLQNGSSQDTNYDGVPDDCEPGYDTATGFVRRWAVIGGFSGYDLLDRLATGCGFTEQNMEASVGDRIGGLAWRQHYAWAAGSDRIVDFYQGLLQNPFNASAYAHAYVYVPTTRTVRALVGSDDQYELYLDGTLWWSYLDSPRTAVADQDYSPPLEVAAGWHRILVQLRNGSDGTWQFMLRLDDGQGNVFSDVAATPTRSEIPADQGLVVPDDVAARPPAILEWLVLGPFEGSGCDFSCPPHYPAEGCVSDCTQWTDVFFAESQTGLGERYLTPVAGGGEPGISHAWQRSSALPAVNFASLDGLLDLNRFFGFDGASQGQINQSVYLHTRVSHRGTPTPVQLVVSTQRAVTAWVNGARILSSCECGPRDCLSQPIVSTPFTLKSGSSSILVRVDGGTGSWGGAISLVAQADGYAVAGTVSSPEAPAVAGGPVEDPCEATVAAEDCNNDGLKDDCQLARGTLLNCDGGDPPIPDVCQIEAGAADCQTNGWLDSCELCSSAPIPTVFTQTVDFTSPSSPLNPDTAPRLTNIDTSYPDELRIVQSPLPNPVIWIACSDRHTVVKIATDDFELGGQLITAGTVLGEYWTAPRPGGWPVHWNPSRTTVDLNGAVWVANRDGSVTCARMIGGAATPFACGSVTRIDDQCIDRNGGGIQTSTTLGQILNWDISGPLDDCISAYTPTVGTGTRGLAIDANNDLWVAAYHHNVLEKVSGSTGLPVEGTVVTTECPAYGGLMDRNGVLWFVARGNGVGELLRYDPAGSSPPCCIKDWKPPCPDCPGIIAGAEELPCFVTLPVPFETVTAPYGIALDPRRGTLWVSEMSTMESYSVSVHELDPLNYGHISAPPYSQGFQAQGIAVDQVGDVWVAGSDRILHIARSASGAIQGSALVFGPAPDSTCAAGTCCRIPADSDGQGQGALTDCIPLLEIPTGVAVDRNNKIWVSEKAGNRASRIDPSQGAQIVSGKYAGAVDLQVDLGEGCGPYNYSDMTGAQLLSAVPRGTWTAIVEGPVAATDWSKVTWTASTPVGTVIEVEARAAVAVNHLSLRPYTPVTSGEDLPTTIMGRYLEVRVTLGGVAQPFTTPVLYDLTVEHTCEFDCNENQGSLDSCDLASGSSQDANLNQIPDDCEVQPIVRFLPVNENGQIQDLGDPLAVAESCALVGLDATESQGEIVRFEWDLEGDGFGDGVDAIGPQVLHMWDVDTSSPACLSGEPDCARRKVGLRLITGSGPTAPVYGEIDVNDVELSASSIRIEGPVEFDVNEEVCFAALIREACDRVNLVQWDFEHDFVSFIENAQGQSQCHTWAIPGPYTIAARVTEDDESANVSRPLMTLDVYVNSEPARFAPRAAELVVEARYHTHDAVAPPGTQVPHRADLRLVNRSDAAISGPFYVGFGQLGPAGSLIIGDLRHTTNPLVDGSLPQLFVPASASLVPNTTTPWLPVTFSVPEASNSPFGYQPVGYSNQMPPAFDSLPVTSAHEGELYVYTARAVDPEGQLVWYEFAPSSQRPEGMFLDGRTGVLSWRPDQQAASGGTGPAGNEYSIIVRARDGYPISYSEQSFVITVARVDVPPRILSQPLTTALVNEVFIYRLKLEDPDGDLLSAQAIRLPPGASFDPATDTVFWIPAWADAGKAYVVELIASDGMFEVSERFSVQVAACADPPILATTVYPSPGTSLSATEGFIFTHQPKLLDPDYAPVFFSLDTAPEGMTIDPDTGLIQWIPSYQDGGPGVIRARVLASTDSAGLPGCSDTEVINIAVAERNTSPTLGALNPQTATEGEPFSLLIPASDDDGDVALRYALTQAPEGMTIDPWYGLLEWAPPQTAGAGTPYTIGVRVADESGAWTESSFPLDVVAVEVPPVITSNPVRFAVEDQPYAYAVAAMDPDDPAGSNLRYALGPDSDAPGMMIDQYTGQIDWSPGATSAPGGPYTVNVVVSDSPNPGALTAIQSFEIDVIETNSPPEIDFTDCLIAAGSLGEGEFLDCHVFVTDPDNGPDSPGDSMTFLLPDGSSCGAAPDGMNMNAATGHLTWQVPYNTTTPALGQATVMIPLEASDGHAAVELSPCAEVVVQNRLQPPAVAAAPPYEALVGQLYSFQLAASAEDVNSGEMVYVRQSGPAGLAISASGLITWQPQASQAGVHGVVARISYTLASQTVEALYPFQIRVAGAANSQPFFDIGASPPLESARVGQPYGMPLTIVDVNTNDRLTLTLIQGPAGTQLIPPAVAAAPPPDEPQVMNITVAWDSPSVEDLGTHEFAVRVEDDHGGRAELWWAVAVSTDGQNSPPRIISVPQERATIGEAYTYAVLAEDVDGSADVLTFALFTAPLGLTIEGSTGRISWADPQRGTHDVEVRVFDGRGGVGRQQYHLVVADQAGNAPPEILSLAQEAHDLSAPEPYQYTIFAVDPDGDLLTYTLLDAPSGMAVDDLEPWLIRWWPLATQVGSHSVSLRVDDGRGGADWQSFTLVVATGGTAPRILSSPRQTAQVGQPYAYAVHAVDDDLGQPLTYILLERPAGMLLANNVLQWIPDEGHIGTHPVHVRVSAGPDRWQDQRFELTVSLSGGNGAPCFVSPAVQGARVNSQYRYQPTVFDPDGGTLAFALAKAPAGMVLENPATGSIRWIPTAAQIGTHEVSLRVTDTQGATALQNFDLAVGSGGSPPVISSSPLMSGMVSADYAYRVTAWDPDNDPLVFSLITAPVGVTISPSTGDVAWSAPLPPGCHEIGIRVDDGQGGQDEQYFSVTVSSDGLNTAPRITSTPSSTSVLGQTYQYDLTAFDPDDNTTLRYAFIRQPAGARIVQTGGQASVLWDPVPAQMGTNVFIVAVHDRPDNGGGCGTQEWHVTVSPHGDNLAPRITSTPVKRAVAGQPYEYAVQAFDPNGDALHFALIVEPRFMTIDERTGAVLWTSAPAGTHEVLIRVEDGRGGRDEQAYRLFVGSSAAEEVPHIVSQPPVTGDLSGYSYPVAVKYDRTPPNLNWSLFYQVMADPVPPPDMHFVSNVLTWDQNVSTGTYTVLIRVSDPDKSPHADQSVTFTISDNGQNIAPRIVSDPILRVVTGRIYDYPVAVEDDDDPSGVILTAAIDERTDFDFGTGPNAHRLTWDTTDIPLGEYEATIVATDPAGGGTSQRFSIHVVENSAPRIESKPPTLALIGTDYAYDATAIDPDELLEDDPLNPRYQLSVVPAVVGLQTDPVTGLIGWDGQQTPPGEYAVRVVVTDRGGLSDEQEFKVRVTSMEDFDLHAPQLTVSAEPFVAGIDEPVWIEVSASDDTGVSETNGAPAVSLTIESISTATGQRVTLETQTLPLDDAGRAEYAFLPRFTGGHVATVMATDLAGKTRTREADFFVPVADVDGDPGFDLEIASPAVDAITDQPSVSILGRAWSENFFKYTLAYRAMGEESFVEFHTGYGPRGEPGGTPLELGLLDPSQLRNGIYQVRLRGIDAGGYALDALTQFTIKNQIKIGNLQLSFADLDIPLAGLPVTITRNYDTRNKQQGDFGYGWTLDVSTMKLEENAAPGEGWSGYQAGWTCLAAPAGDRYVTVTWPDDRVEVFQLTYDEYVACSALFEVYGIGLQPVSPATSVLKVLGVPSPLILNPEDGNLTINGGFGEQPWEPRVYELTAADGTRYEFRKPAGSRSAQVSRIVDRNGNTITFLSEGIKHTGSTLSDGWVVRYVRDSAGRIVEIKDAQALADEAAGDFSRGTLRYGYDDRGDLVAFTDRSGSTTTFRYEDRHAMTEIFGPDGQPLARNIFDDAGRLIAHVDADGNRMDYCREGMACAYRENCEIVFGRAVGGQRSQTVYCYDEEGRVLLKEESVDGQPLATRFEYDGLGNLTRTWLPDNVSYTERTYEGHNIVTDRDTDGNVTTFTYVPGTDLVRTSTDPRGNTTTNEYDSKGNLIKVTRHNPAGRDEVTSYTYDSQGNRLTEMNALGEIIRYEYYPNGQLKKEIDALGNSTESFYDANGNLIRQTRARTNVDLVTGQQSPALMETVYRYDDSDRLVEEVDALGRRTITTYNASGKPETATVVYGSDSYTTTNEYDARGNLVRTIHPDLSETTSVYDQEGRQIRSTDRDGNVTHFVYDELGRIRKTYVPDQTPDDPFNGPFTETVYDALGRVKERYDERRGKIEYVYEPNKQTVIQWVTVDSQLTTIQTVSEFDGAGNVIRTTDNLNRTTSYEYDYAGRLIKTVFHDGLYSLVTYDLAGRKTAERDRAGVEMRYEYDALGRLTKVVSPPAPSGEPVETTYSYDEIGNLISQTDAEERTTRMAYDHAGNITQRQLPEGQIESFAYDDAGRLESHTDFNGQVTSYAYDANGRLELKTLPGAPPATVAYNYKPSGLRTQAGGPARGVGGDRYEYDKRGRLELETKENGDTLEYGYDDSGNRTSMTVTSAAGTTVVTYGFDEMNRLTTVTETVNSAPAVTRYTYDGVGNRATVRYQNGTCAAYEYDDLNRLERLTNRRTGVDCDGPVLSEYEYELGLAGNRTGVTETDAAGNVRVVSYAYDSLYRLTEEAVLDTADPTKDRVVGYTYDRVGNRLIETVQSGGGLSTTATIVYLYDDNDRLVTRTSTTNATAMADSSDETRLAAASPSSWARYSLGLFAVVTAGLGLLPLLPGHRRRSARRASAFRPFTRCVGLILVSVLTLGPENVYALYAQAQAQAFCAKAVSAGALGATTTSHTYGYDDNGNLRSRVASNGSSVLDLYDYDVENRLVRLRRDSGAGLVDQVSYAYDADGIRKAVTDHVGSGSTTYLTDKNQAYAQVVEEQSAAGVVRYTYGDDLIAQTRGAARSYYHYDGQLSVRQLTDAPADPVATPAVVTDTYAFAAFGELLHSTGQTVNNYLYTGEQYDPNVGFYYLRARYYDHFIGRFVAQDSVPGFLSDPLSLHRYLYVGANPVTNVDPSGTLGFSLTSFSISLVIGATLIGIVVGGILGGAKGAVIGGLTGLVLGLFAVAVWGEALFLFAMSAWARIAALAGALVYPASQYLNGPNGRVSLQRLNDAAQASTTRITLWTRISTTPTAQRALNTATNVDLANAGDRVSRNLFRFDIPSRVLPELEAVGLAERQMVLELTGESGIAWVFRPEAVGYITQWMTRIVTP